MPPKKNMGAIGVMCSFLGLAATHLCTAFAYFSCFRNGEYSPSTEKMFAVIGIVEMLLYFALAVSFGFIFVYSEDIYSTTGIVFSALTAILALSARFSSVQANEKLFSILTFVINLCILGIFANYLLKLRKMQMTRLAAAAIAAGLWVSFVSIGFRTAAVKFASVKAAFVVSGLIAVVSAFCYGIAYFSQRQSFE